MRKVLVIHGPNLNLLGRREPEVYGRMTLDDVNAAILSKARELGMEVEIRQSNHEGEIIDWLHGAEAEGFEGVVLNPGGLTHYSVSLRDAIAAIGIPVVEVHLTNIHAREEMRRRTVTGEACWGVISGFGHLSYLLALEALRQREGGG